MRPNGSQKSNPSTVFYWKDWWADTMQLTLECEGAWIRLLGKLRESGGSVTWPVGDFAAFWRTSEENALHLLQQLSRYVAEVQWAAPIAGERLAEDLQDGEVIHSLSTGDLDMGNTNRTQTEHKGNTKEHLALTQNGYTKVMATVSSRRMVREAKKLQELHEVRSAAGKAGRANRWAEKNTKPNTNVEHKTTLSHSHSPSSLYLNLKKDSDSSESPENGNPPKISSQELVESWNEVFRGKLPAVTLPLSKSRTDKVRMRLHEHPDLAFWRSVFNKIAANRFLLGLQDRRGDHGNWRCSFDFVIANDKNCLKIYEGAYDGKNNAG